MNRLSRLWFVVFALVLLSALAARAEGPSWRVFDMMYAKSGMEEEFIKAAKGHAERHGDDLVLWTDKAAGVKSVFHDKASHNPSGEEDPYQYGFEYFGGTDKYDLLLKSFSSDAPLIVFVDAKGHEHNFRSADTDVLITSGQRLVAARSYPSDDDLFLQILAEHAGTGYEEELSCHGPAKEAPAKDRLYAKVASVSDDQIVMEIHRPGNDGETAAPAVGKLHLVRHDGVWKNDGWTLPADVISCKPAL